MADAQNWWETAPLATDDPSFTGYIPGTGPKPAAPPSPSSVWHPMSADEIAGAGLNADIPWQRNDAGEIKPIGGKDTRALPPLAEEDRQQIREEAKQKIKLGLSLIDRSKNGWFTTGAGAGVARGVGGLVGGTPAVGVAADTETLKNAGALARVIELSKKTGKNPLTPLSNSDFQALANSIANLDTNQPDEQYQRNVSTVIDIYKRAYEGAGGNPADIDALMNGSGNAAENAPPPGNAPKEAKPQTVEGLYEGGPQSDAGMGELNAQQKREYAEFWRKNPDPSAKTLSTFLDNIGVPNVREADAANIIKGVKSGLGYSTAVDRTSAARAEVVRQNALRGSLAESDTETLAKSGQSLQLSDEAAGVGRAVSGLIAAPINALRGKSSNADPVANYILGRDAERLRIEDARRQLGWTGTAIEVGGGLLSANPGALSAINLTGRQLAAQGARGGLVGGALAGFGGGEGTQGSITGGIVGGLGGAAVGGALGGLSGRLARPVERPDVARAAVDEGIELPGMMVTGSRRDINRAGALESGGGEAPVVIQEGFGDVANAIEGRTAALGGGGTGRSEEAIGESVQRAGRRFIQRSKGVADTLYTRARNLAGDARITPRESLNQLREELRQLSETPNVNQGEIDFINELGADITNGPLSVDAVRNLRTSIRGRITQQGLTSSQADARAVRIMDALQQDAQASLPPAAAQAFRRADMYYRERMVHIDDVLDRFIGGERGVAKLSGEQAFRKVKSMADSDGRRLAAIMRDLTGPERQDVAATIAQSLGRTADDAPFTVDQFIRQTNKFSPSARRTIFGPDGAQSIENLRLLSRRLQEIQGQVNRSRTGNVVARTIRAQAGNVITALLGGGGFAAGGPMGGAGGAAAGLVIKGALDATGQVRRVLSARALMSPRVTNWLLRASNVNTPRQAQEVVRSLGTVIAREPALANELTPIQRYLSGQVASPVAASDAEQGGADNE